MNAADTYRERFRRALHFIDNHIDNDTDQHLEARSAPLSVSLSVEALSHVAAFSKFHFHRQFSALFGLSVYRYIQLVRLKRASYQLAFRAQRRILDIALESGYESHEAFARAFKKALGQAPSEFRERPEWENWHAIFDHVIQLRSMHMKPDLQNQTIALVDFPATRVAVLEHRGDPRQIGNTIRRFIDWRKQNQLPPRLSATFNILYNHPDSPPDEFHIDLCAATRDGVAENTHGVIEKVIPEGRCARLRHLGSDDTLADSIQYLYGTWLPTSGHEPRDFPLFVQRVQFFPDVPEHQAITDIFLPIQ